MNAYRDDMPRLHVHLPDDLYQIVKERQLPASKLLQEAVRAERRGMKRLVLDSGVVSRLSGPADQEGT